MGGAAATVAEKDRCQVGGDPRVGARQPKAANAYNVISDLLRKLCFPGLSQMASWFIAG